MVAEFPNPDQRFDDPGTEDEMAWIIEVVNGLRSIRGEMNLPPSEQISVYIRMKGAELEKKLRKQEPFIQSLASVKELKIGQNIEKPVYSAYAVVRDVEILVPMDRTRMEEEAK